MRNMVQVLVQPRWTEWRQNSAIRVSRRFFNEFLWQLDNSRWASGKGSLNRSKLLEYKEVRNWLSDRYIELRGKYEIRMTYAEFEPLVMSWKYDLGDEWIIRRSYGAPQGHSFRHGWGYTQNPEHRPKDRPTYDPWYVENRHKRDKAKAGRFAQPRRKFWVKQAAKDHRAWVKRQLKAENWDAFGRGPDDSEYIIDPWLWD